MSARIDRATLAPGSPLEAAMRPEAAPQGVPREQGLHARRSHVTFRKRDHSYRVDGRPPSVTQILAVLNKPGLSWWGMTVGVQAVCELARAGVEIPFDDPAAVVELLRERRLTVAHTFRAAGERSASIHQALQRYATDERKLSLSGFPREHRGYVFALASGRTFNATLASFESWRARRSAYGRSLTGSTRS